MSIQTKLDAKLDAVQNGKIDFTSNPMKSIHAVVTFKQIDGNLIYEHFFFGHTYGIDRFSIGGKMIRFSEVL